MEEVVSEALVRDDELTEEEYEEVAKMVNGEAGSAEDGLKVCPKCGYPNRPDAKFCVKCGAPLV